MRCAPNWSGQPVPHGRHLLQCSNQEIHEIHGFQAVGGIDQGQL
jgi:hypothetical protein